MILPVFENRAALPRGAAGLSWRRRLWIVTPALAVFGVALALPAIRVRLWGGEPTSEPGYTIAFWTEANAFEAGHRLAQAAWGKPISQGALDFSGSWPVLAGATANHLFALACLATLFRRLRLAAALAGIAALLTVGCMFPEQILEWNDGWLLGPGYFVWCAAPVVLMVETWKADRRLRSEVRRSRMEDRESASVGRREIQHDP
jgi:hypothetical protein